MGASVTQITRYDTDAWGNQAQTPMAVAGSDGMEDVVFYHSYPANEPTSVML